MIRTLALASLFSLTAQAAYLDTVCKSALQKPGVVFADGVVSHLKQGRYVMESLNGEFIFEHSSAIKSVVTTANHYWVLSKDELLQVSKTGQILFRVWTDKNTSMTLAGNNLLIIKNHGKEMMAFDIDTKKDVWTSQLKGIKNGQALSVVFDGKNAQVITTASAEGGFNGIATVDPSNGRVTKQTGYNYVTAGVIDPEANARWFNGNLVINNGGWIHIVTPAQLAKGKPIRPKWHAQAVGQGSTQHYMMLRGEFFFEGQTLVGCGLYNEDRNGDWLRFSKLFKVQMP